jgi:putative phage-type endonuclease
MTEDEWLEARKLGIGGSEIGTICGLNPYQSKYNLWACKKNLVEGFKGNEATDLGHLLEPAVAERYATVTNSAIVTWPVILRPKANGFMSGNVDRFIVTPSDDFPAGKVTYWETTEPPPRIIALLECKTGGMVSPGKPQEWFVGGASIPPSYELQGHWYLASTGLDRIEYAALLGGHGFQTRTLLRDDDMIANLMDIVSEFWNTNFLGNVEPELDGTESTEETLTERYPRSVEGITVDGGAPLMDAWLDLELAKVKFKDAEADKKLARSKVVAILGDAEYGISDGVPLCSFRSGKDGEYFADKILEADDPVTYRKYLRTKPGFRTLRAKK